MGLLHDLNDGRKREISEADYDYFLGVLPPVAFRFTWNGERWGFGFAEGADHIYAFKKEGDKFFAQKTNLLNPHEFGVPLAVQLERLAGATGGDRSPLRGSSWIPTWMALGKKYPSIRLAHNPRFDTQSFHECKDDNELLDMLAKDTWPAGRAFYRGDVCFIQEVDGGEEWLAIKQDRPIRTILWSWIIKDRGRAAAQTLLDQIRAAAVERRLARDF